MCEREFPSVRRLCVHLPSPPTDPVCMTVLIPKAPPAYSDTGYENRYVRMFEYQQVC